MSSTGLNLESYKFHDLSHEKVFGSAPSDIQIKPLGRDVSGIPIVFQGDKNTCVACAFTWIRQWMEKDAARTSPTLSWPFLAQIANIGPNGASPSQVLTPAEHVGICEWDTFQSKTIQEATSEAGKFLLPQATFLTDYSPQGLYAALQRGPLAIGVRNWKNIGDHMMALYEAVDNVNAKARSWWDVDHQTDEIVSWEQIEVAISFAPIGELITSDTHAIDPLTVFIDKFVSFFKYVK